MAQANEFICVLCASVEIVVRNVAEVAETFGIIGVVESVGEFRYQKIKLRT